MTNDALFLTFDGQDPQWQPLPDLDALFPLPQGLAKLHVVAWLTPQRLDPLLEALDRLGEQPQPQIIVHLVLGEGFETAEVACEYVHDVEAVLLANDQPQITTLIGESSLTETPVALGAMIRQASGARQFLSLQAIRFAAEDGVTPDQVQGSVLDLAYEGLGVGEPVLIALPEAQIPLLAQFFNTSIPV